MADETGLEIAARPVPIPSWLALGAYALAADLLVFPMLALAAPLLLMKAKRRKTVLPRLGLQHYPENVAGRGGPVWVHALSVGELLSAVPFVRGLKKRLGGRPLVVSVSTLAARELAEVRLGGIADGLVYFPYDTAVAYRRCVGRIGPALFLLIETDIWPGYLRHLRRRGVPCWLLNGRLSPRSFAQRRRWACLFDPTMRCFERVHGQSAAENERFRQCGVPADRLGEPGNLKYDAGGGAPSAEAVRQLRRDLGYAAGDVILLAGSTHAGEEAIVRRAYLALRGDVPGLKLIVVPRHPHRAAEVRQLWADDGIETGVLSEGRRPAPEVLVVDQLGRLSALYGVCAVALVGGSFAAKGGQSPIEPAAAGKPVIFGPDMSSFPEVAPELVAAGGAFVVRDESEIVARGRALLLDTGAAVAAGGQARRVVEVHAGVTSRLIEAAAQRVEGGVGA